MISEKVKDIFTDETILKLGEFTEKDSSSSSSSSLFQLGKNDDASSENNINNKKILIVNLGNNFLLKIGDNIKFRNNAIYN